MGICGLCMNKDKNQTENDENANVGINYEELKNKIKREAQKIHSFFKENLDESINTDLFFYMERIKLVLSEFSDVISWKLLNYPIDFEEADFVKIYQFLNELEYIYKTKNEKEYEGVLIKYKTVIDKAKNISHEGINTDIIANE